MVQAMDHEAVEGDMDQEVEGDIDGASDVRSNGWYKRWITKQSKEIYGSGSCRRSDGWCKRWKER